NHQVLVLNRYWVAVHVCTVRRALTLVFQELARIVSEDFQTYDFESWRELSQFGRDAHPVIHTPNFSLLVPHVIVLSRYHRVPPRTVKFNRRNIFLRDQYCCQYCGRRPHESELSIDHVVPRSRGGTSRWENVVLACVACNTKKGNRLLAECGMQLIRPPRKPAWLSTLQQVHLTDDNRSLWEKFVDIAYWETNLRE
ncbi:MAG TPA: HNH endonuclease, partial [Candidatus Sumerlaeota bacterium]|nr:HNH endonuclease [Candidatus Sumerlaeota bacterium]